MFRGDTVQPLRDELPGRSDNGWRNINDVPVIDYSRCTGCGVCATKCPGLAIDQYQEREDGMALVGIPYEFSPRSREGPVGLCNRQEWRGTLHARVDRVTRSANKTNIVYLTVQKNWERRSPHTCDEKRRKLSDLSLRRDNLEQVKKAIREGYVDFEELRR